MLILVTFRNVYLFIFYLAVDSQKASKFDYSYIHSCILLFIHIFIHIAVLEIFTVLQIKIILIHICKTICTKECFQRNVEKKSLE